VNSVPEELERTDPSLTRERLLDAAVKLFAENGFDATSVRDLTTAAGCNVAAVNYHFGGKDKLYLGAFRRLLQELREQRISSIRSDMAAAGDGATLELFLESFAASFLGPFTQDSRGREMMAFLDREMHNRHLPGDVFVNEMIRPVMEVSVEVLAEVLPALDAETARLCVMSLVGQLIHALKARKMFLSQQENRLIPGDFQAVIRHILRFSAAGFRALAEERE
jgi:AcrR family transcriptional regulator